MIWMLALASATGRHSWRGATSYHITIRDVLPPALAPSEDFKSKPGAHE
jgi:hypothetical protein